MRDTRGKDPLPKLPPSITPLGFDPFGWFEGDIGHSGHGFGFLVPPKSPKMTNLG